MTTFNEHATMIDQYFGVKIGKLGCVMLDFEPLPVAEWLPAKWAYVSENPERHWITGYDVKTHATLKFGLLANANHIKPQVDAVLEGWDPSLPVTIIDVDIFHSTFPDEPYKCLMGKLDKPHLVEANRRLSFLPHVDTFPYEPHITFGYVRAGYEGPATEIIRAALGGPGVRLTPTGLDYGRE
jgi:hypothetical protein